MEGLVLEGATGATVGVPEGSNIGAILLGELDGAVVGDKVVEIYEVQPETLDDTTIVVERSESFSGAACLHISLFL